ncbi:hypothetical protein HDU84_008407 [Entophlyctis sp. JEL0112]|nr:hypothetical protein HDU84_008407 [Entophlyctis sp. JEL0112]
MSFLLSKPRFSQASHLISGIIDDREGLRKSGESVGISVLFEREAIQSFIGAEAMIGKEWGFVSHVEVLAGKSFDAIVLDTTEGSNTFSGTDLRQQRSVWERELESVRELVELEPESKWPLMALVHIMNELGGKNDECIAVLERLRQVDPDRDKFYADYISDLIWKAHLPTFPESTYVFAPKSELYSRHKLTRIPSPHAFSPAAVKICIARQALTAVPSFPNVQELDLSDNMIEQIDDKAFVDMPMLEVLRLAGNPLRMSENSFVQVVKGAGPKLRKITVERNGGWDGGAASGLMSAGIVVEFC